jgi:hypothetical protein
METDDSGAIRFGEVAANSVLNGAAQIVEGLGLREDRVTKSASFIPALGRLLNCEDDFGLSHEVSPLAIIDL